MYKKLFAVYAVFLLFTAFADKVSDVDKNFKREEYQGENLIFQNILDNENFVLEGFPWRKKGEILLRLPLKNNLSKNLNVLAARTSGGTLRFKTDSRKIALRVKYKGAWLMPHMPLTGSAGFDVFLNAGSGKDSFYRNIAPGKEHIAGKIFTAWLAKINIPKREFFDWTIYLPLYSGIESMEIGIEPDAQFQTPRRHKITKPIVFYGSSITQGGCASRPANNYTTMLCRTFDAPQVNLGFSGNAKGEEEMANHIAALEMSLFVLDYDYNSPSADHLQKTHSKFFNIIRKAHPDLPIIILSRVSNYTDARTAVIRKTYEDAIAAGDKNVWFIEGKNLIASEAKIFATVDGCHPTDLGFYMMYHSILPTMAKILGHNDILK